MDDELTLHELRRLETERRLRSIPQEVLETAWVREAQVEAVIDAVLAVTHAGSAEALAHARQVGEWCARIAAGLPFGPDPSFARRVGVLADVDPGALAWIPELERFAEPIREYQTIAIEQSSEPTTMSLVLDVADEFARRIEAFASRRGPSPSAIIRSMAAEADDLARPVVEALECSVHANADISRDRETVRSVLT